VKLVVPQRSPVHIDLTPLVDVVFILLVFVLLAASFARQPSVAVALPQANGATPITEQALVVTIESDGRLWIDGKSVAAENVGQVLQSRRDRFAALTVRADGEVALARAVYVLDAARSAGFEKLSIATRRPQQRRR